jgi:hypothetical protein
MPTEISQYQQEEEARKELNRAKARIRRAHIAGKEPSPMDLQRLEQAGQEVPQAPYRSPQAMEQNPPLRSSSPMEKPSDPDTTGLGLKDIPEAAKVPQRKPSGSKERSWHDFFANRFGPFIVMVLWFATADLDKASFYAPSPEECQTAALPLSKIATRVESWLNVPTWMHDVVVSTDDVVTLGMVAMSYLDRIGYLNKLAPYFSGAAARMRKMNVEAKSPGTHAPVQPSSNGHQEYSELPFGIGSQWVAEG